MTIDVETAFKKQYVQAIVEGLDESREYYDTPMVVRNARNFKKMDDMANAIIEAFRDNNDYRITLLPRGSYKVALLYHTATRTLITFVSKKSFENNLNKIECDRSYYMYALFGFNGDCGFKPMQISLGDMFNEECLGKMNGIRGEVVQLLDGDVPDKYITVCIDMKDFMLMGIEAVLTNEHLDVIDTEDWSEYIEVDYIDVPQHTVLGDIDDIYVSIKPKYNKDAPVVTEKRKQDKSSQQ